ncbi:MAG: sigma-70 family RNA polymerase sigma factor [Prevotella sp.]|nr:sigma-70 family RNA polymerase sigma factor [Prevotella sp.]MBR1462517.1 sigma-70 family RNA polymerase sigma factor [Prevotella sp.]
MRGIIRHKDVKTTAMESLYATYYPRLFGYSFTLLNDEDEAADVVSDAFEKVWSKWCADESFNPSSAYLFSIVRNRSLELLRHDEVRRRYAAAVAAMPELAYHEGNDELERELEMLIEEVNKLEEPDRSILHCHYFRKMTYQETAEALHLSAAVVKRHMLKIFKDLRAALKKEK